MTLVANYQFNAIGTSWNIETQVPLSGAEKHRIRTEIKNFTHTYSRFDPRSLVSRANRQVGRFQFPDSIKEITKLYQTLYAATEGSINPLIGNSLEQLGYDQSYSLISHGPALPAPPLATLQLYENFIELQSPALLDIGAVGKGYLVDQITTCIKLHHAEYVVDGSGDIAIHTTIPQVIGLEHPADASRVIGTINLTNGSVAASAPNRRAWGDGLHHIIDATTGLPTDSNVLATWVVAASTMLADGLATALFFATPSKLQQYVGAFRYVIMTRDGAVQHNITDIGEIYT